MYAIIPLSSSSPTVAVEAKVTPSTTPGEPATIEYLFKNTITKDSLPNQVLFNGEDSLSALEKRELDLERRKIQIGINRTQFNQLATAIAEILQKYCVTPPSPSAAAAAASAAPSFSLQPSTLYKRKKTISELIEKSQTLLTKAPEELGLLDPEGPSDNPPVLEIHESTSKGREGSGRSSKQELDEPGSEHVSTAVDRSQHVSSLEDRGTPRPSITAPKTCGKRAETLQEQALYNRTQRLNAQATPTVFLPLPFAGIALITNLVGLLLTTNIPSCTDGSESSHKTIVYAFNWITAGFSCLAAIASCFSRSAILSTQIPSYKFQNPSILELSQQETAEISHQIARQKGWYPDCLLPSRARQIRENMLTLGKYARIDRKIADKIAGAHGKKISDSQSIENQYIGHSRVISKLNLFGMLAMVGSTAGQITLLFTEDPTVLDCNQHPSSLSGSSSHDLRNDLTNDSAAPFIITFIGCTLLVIDAFRKWSHNKDFLAFQKTKDVVFETV